MARQRSKLVWGVTLLTFGALWLLHEAGHLRGNQVVMFVFATVFLSLAGLFYARFQGDPDRRYGSLIPAGISASLGFMILGIAFRIPASLQPLVFFAGPAVAFAYIHALDRTRNWALLSACAAAMFGLAGFVGSWSFLGGDLAPMIFLAGTGALFVWHFLRAGKDWALIPGGIMLTTSLLPLIDRITLVRELAPAVACFGFAATFAAVFFLGRPGSSGWARYPAVALAVCGCLALFVGIAESALVYALPIALIGVGIYLIRNSLGAGTNGSSGPALTPPAP
jgi:hypothetical protein